MPVIPDSDSHLCLCVCMCVWVTGHKLIPCSVQCWRGADGAPGGAVLGLHEKNPGGQSPWYHPDHPNFPAGHEGPGRRPHPGHRQHWRASRWDEWLFEESLCAGTVPHVQRLARLARDRKNKLMPRLAVKPEVAKIIHLRASRSVPGLPFNEVYCASKFAIEGACESLAVLLHHFNIQWVWKFAEACFLDRGRNC